MKSARSLLLLLPLLAGCNYHDTFVLKPGEHLLITNSRIRSVSWESDYPITVTEGNCKVEDSAQGTIECEHAANIVIQDLRPTLLIWAHANSVRVTYPMFSRPTP